MKINGMNFGKSNSSRECVVDSEGDLSLLCIPLDDIEGRIFEIRNGSAILGRFADLANAANRIDEILIKKDTKTIWS